MNDKINWSKFARRTFEEDLRENNASVKDAWEKYQTVLRLAMDNTKVSNKVILDEVNRRMAELRRAK